MADVNAILAYLMIYKDREENYTGGVLITDGYGIPLEFKYSEPIKPTNLQKILYGKSIEKFITVDIISKKLLLSVQEKPRFVLINDLSLINSVSKYPLVYIYSASKETQEEENIDREEFTVIDIGQQMNLMFKGKLTSEEQQWFQKLAREFDMTEPFVRLKEAVVYVCSKE